MLRARTALAVSLAALAAPGSAAALQFSIVPGGRTPGNIGKIERAITYQVNHQVARYYHVDPVSFVSAGSGNPVYIVSRAEVQSAFRRYGGSVRKARQALAFHAYDSITGEVVVYVWGTTPAQTGAGLSHEVVEASVDPLVEFPKLEICDPVDGQSYLLFGIRVARWVRPNGRAFP